MDGLSALRKVDVRFKIIILVSVNIAVLGAGPAGLRLLFAMSAGVFVCSRFSLKRFFGETKYFLVFLLFIFATRSLSAPGEALFETESLPFSVSVSGVRDGFIVCVRLFIMALAGLIFVRVSRMFEIKAGIQWFLKPLPGVPEKRIAVMIGLMIRFLPLILETARNVSEAQKARAAANRKNPLLRLKNLVVPLARQVLGRADHLARAMTARCYSEDRTDPELISDKKDWLVLAAVLPICLTACFI